MSQRPDRPVLLVVDDQPSNVRLIAEPLQAEYEVRFATGGEKAVEMIEGGGIDLVLLDVVMPGVDGFEVCRQIRASNFGRDLPVIFVTSLSPEEAGSAELEDAGVDWLTKPVDPDLVRRRIEANLRIPRGLASPEAREKDALRILLVDDDELTRTVHRHYCETLGHLVDEAEDGAAALERAGVIRYDWIFIDLEMPVMNGFDTVEELRRNETGDRCAIVALSAHDDPAVKRRALSAGFDLYLEKPVDRRALEELLSRPASAARAPERPQSLDQDLAGALPAFVENKRADVQRLQRLLEIEDLESLRSLSHKLRGTFALYGFADASDLCRRIEEIAGEGRTDGLAELISILDAKVG